MIDNKFSIEHINYYVGHICVLHNIESHDKHSEVEKKLEADVQAICDSADVNVWVPKDIWGQCDTEVYLKSYCPVELAIACRRVVEVVTKNKSLRIIGN